MTVLISGCLGVIVGVMIVFVIAHTVISRYIDDAN